MTDEEWTEWFLHDGKGCPVQRGVYVGVEMACGCKAEHVVDDLDFFGFDWKPDPSTTRCRFCYSIMRAGTLGFIRYRIRKPRALRQLREIAENVKEGVEA